ncbi:hypothetical protein BCR41DRAFT_49180 [Lobosporangium transversale]|uniref:Uncharacterized protein n=1 Tax=Lobosporangium transversale TaxID=64571 RepID=A0A1Y2GP52_9FUNG|nr:hypothetical protein BCR41DRAFT_49180 [Lobosporangium transversale]ORZ17479.1 hypothetical protein BCR41DRAFT_49180 [Lobosporangium transversale]|eukprot:XP_021881866.1 hypothetical protein BCR41DRAFT_49180 [Lobosporangium transversale]
MALLSSIRLLFFLTHIPCQPSFIPTNPFFSLVPSIHSSEKKFILFQPLHIISLSPLLFLFFISSFSSSLFSLSLSALIYILPSFLLTLFTHFLSQFCPNT